MQNIHKVPIMMTMLAVSMAHANLWDGSKPRDVIRREGGGLMAEGSFVTTQEHEELCELPLQPGRWFFTDRVGQQVVKDIINSCLQTIKDCEADLRQANADLARENEELATATKLKSDGGAQAAQFNIKLLKQELKERGETLAKANEQYLNYLSRFESFVLLPIDQVGACNHGKVVNPKGFAKEWSESYHVVQSHDGYTTMWNVV